MVSPITVAVRARPRTIVEASPLTVILVVPQIDEVPTTDVTIGAPANELTSITAANAATMLGVVPAANPGTQTPISRAAYDLIESGATVHLLALPFAVASTDSAAARAGKVASALTTALRDPVQVAKLPEAGADIICLPRETTVSAQAGTIISALRTVCGPQALECVAIVDAGDSAAAKDMRPVVANPTQQSVETWAGSNGGLEIYAISNRADVANYQAMWGSVIMTAHHARYASTEGIGTSPYDLVHPAAAGGNIAPPRVFSLTDGSSSAVVLDRDYEVSSLITHGGSQFIWGGQSGGATDDAREQLANHIVCNRSLGLARRQAAQVVRRRATGDRLQSLRVGIEDAIRHAYVPQYLSAVEVDTPVLAGNILRVVYDLAFYDYIQSVQLTAEVYVA